MSEKDIIPELGDLPDFLSNEPFLDSSLQESDLNESYFKNNKDPRKNFFKFQNSSKSQVGPKWNTVKATDFLSKEDFKNVSQQLENVKTILDQAQTVLSTAEQVVEIIKQIEGAVQDIIGQILDSIIKILESFMKNLKSTGVYFLDMTDYIKKSESGSITSRFSKSLNNKPPINIESEYKKNFINNNQKIDRERINFDYASKTEGDEIELNSNRINIDNDIPWRTISYSEFINTIANAFINNNDIPSKTETASKMEEQVDFSEKISNMFKNWSDSENWEFMSPSYEPGAPQWGVNSISYSTVIALNVTDVKILLEILSEIENFTKNWIPNIQQETTEVDPEENNLINKRIQVPSNGPKWKGVSLETLLKEKFPPFVLMNDLISFLKTLKKQSKSITDLLDKSIKYLQFYIKKIRRLILILNLIVKLIETIERLSFNILVIQSKDGVFDIYDQLRSATGYPGQEEDVEDLILGVVLAAGTTSPNSSDYNFGSIFQEANQIFDEETQSLKDLYNSPKDGGESGLKRFTSYFKP